MAAGAEEKQQNLFFIFRQRKRTLLFIYSCFFLKRNERRAGAKTPAGRNRQREAVAGSAFALPESAAASPQPITLLLKEMCDRKQRKKSLFHFYCSENGCTLITLFRLTISFFNNMKEADHSDSAPLCPAPKWLFY